MIARHNITGRTVSIFATLENHVKNFFCHRKIMGTNRIGRRVKPEAIDEDDRTTADEQEQRTAFRPVVQQTLA